MNEINIGLRQEQLRDLQEYIKHIDKDITLILQSLQWDRKHLQQSEQKLTCRYDSNHRIPANRIKEHEEKCYLKSQNYVPGDLFFPEPLDPNAVTVVKLSADNINDIINYAVKTDPSFKRNGSESCVLDYVPMTLGRLQAAHSTDERRALYDAVAAAAPPLAPHDPPGSDPATGDPAATSAREGSCRDSLLALRDARRRRAKYRGAARDGYQHELRGLISAQMELFTGKLKEEETDNKPAVTVDQSDDGRRCGRESDRRDRVRNDGRTKHLNPSRREHVEIREDKKKEYERGNERKEYERGNERKEYERGNERKEYERESIEDQRREYERETRRDKKKEYSRESREGKTKVYECDKKYKEGNKKYEHDDRRRSRQYDKEYLEIKQEKDDYQADKRKREERRYDYKHRKQETDRSRSRDNKKYHKREERHHKHKSDERHRGGSRDKEYDRNNKSDINSSCVKIKKELPDYD